MTRADADGHRPPGAPGPAGGVASLTFFTIGPGGAIGGWGKAANRADNPPVRTTLLVFAILVVAAAMAWASDAITLQGERTVYTVDCRDGQWQGPRCSGKLAAGQRYRFRALRAHAEVLFWTVGATDEPTGKFTSCRVTDGRNWTCPPNADASRTVTLEMKHGTPVPDATGRAKPYHAVAKWRWWLATSGIPIGGQADN